MNVTSQLLRNSFAQLAILTGLLASPSAYAACSGTATSATCNASGATSLSSVGGATGSNPQLATPYPLNNDVSGFTGNITSLQVRLNGLTREFAEDMDMILVAPNGQAFVFWSDVGVGSSINNQTITVSDAAASDLPSSFAPATGSFRPKNYGTFADVFPSPASLTATGANSASPFGTATFASRFNGLTPNGTWKLYISLDAGPASGSLTSWDLIITTQASISATTTALTSSANPVLIPLSGNSIATITATVTSGGNPVTSGAVTFSRNGVPVASNVAVNGSGQASFTFNTTGQVSPVFPEGNALVSAQYNGTASFSASSGSITQVVDRATLIAGNTFCNTGSITLSPNLNGPASVYPSKLFVTGLGGSVQRVVLDLKGFTTPSTEEVNLLLVSPSGQKFVPFAFVSDAASATSGADIQLSDTAANALPASGPITTGTYLPKHEVSATALLFPAPAPSGPYSSPAPTGSTTFASVFGGNSPNGTWSLFAVNRSGTGAAGLREITGGWCLTIGTTSDTPTTTLVSVAPTPSALNEVTTVSAVVSSATSGIGVNGQGTVTFREGATVLAGPLNLTSNGQTSFSKSDFSEGAHFVDALYSGVPGSFGPSSGQTLHFVDGPTTSPFTGQFCNASPVTFPNLVNASGSPYPTRIQVSGMAGQLSKVTISLNGLSHASPDDLDLMVGGPNGANLIVLSDVGGTTPINGLNLVLDSTAAITLPDSTALSSGTFRPADFQSGSDTFAAPAPSTGNFSASTVSLTSAFDAINPNGVWTLWTANDAAGAQGGGSLSGGWCVNLTMIPPALTISKTHSGNFTQGQTGATYTVTVGSSGPGSTAGTITVVDNPPTGLTITGMSGNGWTCNVANRTCTTNAVLAANATLPPITVTVAVSNNASSPLVNSVTVSGGGATGATANDSTTILPGATTVVTVNVPNGVSFNLDGQIYTGSQSISLPPGTYVLGTTTPQSLGAGARAVFSNWSDGGAIVHLITVGASPLTITGNFTTQFQLTLAASPANGGNVTPASGTFFDSGTVVNVSATAISGFNFANWTGAVANPAAAATTVVMDAAKAVTANFTAATAAPNVTSQVAISLSLPAFNRATGRFSQTVTLTNNGPALASAAYVIDNLAAGYTVFSPAGLTSQAAPAGSPFVEIGGIASGATVTFTVQFTRTGTPTLTYTPRVLGPGTR